MSRTLGAALVAALIAVGLLSAPPAAHAADRTGSPVIVSPQTWSAVDAGWQGTVVVDFSNAPLGQYSVAAFDGYGSRGHGTWVETFGENGTVVVEESTGVLEFAFTEPLVKPGTYHLNVADTNGTHWVSVLQVFANDADGDRPVLTPIGDVLIDEQTTTAVDMSGARIGLWHVELCTNVTSADSSCRDIATIDNTQDTATVPVTVPAVQRPGRATLSVYHGASSMPRYAVSKSFDVIAPLAVTQVRAVPEKFFPTVKDGFRDRTSIKFDTRYDQPVNYAKLRVFDGDDQVYAEEWDFHGGFGWDGRDSRGNLLPTGRYRAEVTARTKYGYTDTARTFVEIARRTVHDSGTLERRGTDTSSRSKTPGCYIRGYSGELTLDCWGGKAAVASYAFRVPRDASKFNFDVRGTVNCCDTGVLSRTGRRVSARKYVVTVRATGWRSFTVRRVELKWDSYTQQ